MSLILSIGLLACVSPQLEPTSTKPVVLIVPPKASEPQVGAPVVSLEVRDQETIVRWEGQEIPAGSDLKVEFASKKAKHPGVEVVLQAAPELEYRKVIELMDALVSVGFTDVKIETFPGPK